MLQATGPGQAKQALTPVVWARRQPGL